MGKASNEKGYWEYDPVIYPRVLWVAVGQKVEELKGTFACADGSEWVHDDDVDYDGLTVSEMERREDGRMGELVVFKARRDMTMSVCAHEASHVCDAIEEAIGMEHGGEASAYLTGWIAGCINKARLGIGDFVGMGEGKEAKG